MKRALYVVKQTYLFNSGTVYIIGVYVVLYNNLI